MSLVAEPLQDVVFTTREAFRRPPVARERLDPAPEAGGSGEVELDAEPLTHRDRVIGEAASPFDVAVVRGEDALVDERRVPEDTLPAHLRGHHLEGGKRLLRSCATERVGRRLRQEASDQEPSLPRPTCVFGGARRIDAGPVGSGTASTRGRRGPTTRSPDRVRSRDARTRP